MKVFKLDGWEISEGNARNLVVRNYLAKTPSLQADLDYVDWLFKTTQWGFHKDCRDRAAEVITEIEPRLKIEVQK